LKDNNIDGPIFVSIGDSDKLQEFLKKNPNIPPDSMFVDDYNFGAYKSVGFQSFTDVDKDVVKNVKLSAPDLSFSQWMDYFGSVMKVSPIPKDMKFGEIPEGVLRLGGTFILRGKDVVYQWSDIVPGDHPDIQQVLDQAKGYAEKKNFFDLNVLQVLDQVKEIPERKFFGLF